LTYIIGAFVLLIAGLYLAGLLTMQTAVCSGAALIAAIVIAGILWAGRGTKYVRSPKASGKPKPQALPGGSGPFTVDVWDEIKRQGQPAITATQAANRAELERAARVWELTGNVGLPDVQILPRGARHQLSPGEPSVIVVLTPAEKERIERR